MLTLNTFAGPVQVFLLLDLGLVFMGHFQVLLFYSKINSKLCPKSVNLVNLNNKYSGIFIINSSHVVSPADIYLFKVINGNSRTICQICSKVTIKAPKRLLTLHRVATKELHQKHFQRNQLKGVVKSSDPWIDFNISAQRKSRSCSHMKMMNSVHIEKETKLHKSWTFSKDAGVFSEW